MSKTYLVKDALEVFFESINGKNYFLGLTTESSIARNMEQEIIKAGIGSKTVGVLSSDDGWEVGVTTGLYYEDIAELQLGNEFEQVTDIEIMDVIEGEDGEITATQETVSGNVIELEADAFPKAGKLQLHTIAHDEDNNVVADIYYIFYKAMPDGNFEQTFGMGENNIQEVNFTPITPKGKKSYGRYIIVPRDQGVAEGTGDDIGA